ncbi:MAG: response regulator transcription factor [Candidatus Wallbacteria bacterium]|nr:response regulator transcription factor [Candidatus Wallbacteria bacterium]
MKRITVLLADDHTIVRQGFRALLALESDIEVVGEAQTGRQAVELTKKLQPAVVVMDIGMPILNGLEAARQILKDVPDTKVIILSVHSDDAYIEQVHALGLSGYLVKQTSAEILARAIREVLKGNIFFSPSISDRIQKQYKKTSGQKNEPLKKINTSLTSREVEVLQQIAEGKANKQIAAELKISIKTVEKHRSSLMEKLDIHDTAGLTRYAISMKIIENNTQITIL